ncbi:conserved domain protein [Roseibium sp. TrichSKD4]|uniref:hypothetical protein n=1 Tax=Roseibium sp. TrichSKD4 TaxID=744980 RepID=UPI0001E56FDD|nr:hypothetical protein [Roseibium sp. TrichSKD4]EFO31366.1 conserved domain protein [Roseibium sp. TrichSKD4]
MTFDASCGLSDAKRARLQSLLDFVSGRAEQLRHSQEQLVWLCQKEYGVAPVCDPVGMRAGDFHRIMSNAALNDDAKNNF